MRNRIRQLATAAFTVGVALVALTLLTLALLACAPTQPAPAGGVFPDLATATPLPTAAVADPATPLPTAALTGAATPLPTAALAPAATDLPTATPLPVSPEGVAQTLDQAEADAARQRFESLLRASWATDFTRATISLDEIMTGGPPKDGIPAIDDPTFESIANADAWLDDLEPVQVVDLNGDARAYPVQVMVWHELVNDTVGGEPVVITF